MSSEKKLAIDLRSHRTIQPYIAANLGVVKEKEVMIWLGHIESYGL